MARQALAVRSDLAADARIFGSKAVELSRGHKGAIIGRLNEVFGSDENRRVVLAWLFRGGPAIQVSSRDLTDGEWFALDRWLDSYKDDSGEWHTSPEFVVEAVFVLREAIKAYVASVFRVNPNGPVAEAAVLPGYKTITYQGDH